MDGQLRQGGPAAVGTRARRTRKLWQRGENTV